MALQFQKQRAVICHEGFVGLFFVGNECTHGFFAEQPANLNASPCMYIMY